MCIWNQNKNVGCDGNNMDEYNEFNDGILYEYRVYNICIYVYYMVYLFWRSSIHYFWA